MRTALLMLCALSGLGCSALFDAGRFQGGTGQDGGQTVDAGRTDGGADAGTDAGTDASTTACTSAAECAGNAPACDAGACVDCDADGDLYYRDGAACAALRAGAEADCDDARDDVHPGAPPVCGDGVVNGCAPVPADVAAALGVGELAVVDVTQLYLTAADSSIEPITIVAFQSNGGEPNAAVAARVASATGEFSANLFAFDHTAPAPVTPIEPRPTSRAPGFVSSFDIWQTSPTEATAVLEGRVFGSTGGESVPFFGRFGVGVGALDVDPVEPDRASCPFGDVSRRTWSASGDWYAFIGRDLRATGDVYSLHAVRAGGPIRCIPDLAAAGAPVSEFPLMIGAAGVLFLTNYEAPTDPVHVWHPTNFGGIVAQPSGVFGEPPMVQVGGLGDGQLLVADGGTTTQLDCNTGGACDVLGTHSVPAPAGYPSAMARWGAGAALATGFRDVPDDDGTLRSGIDVRIVSATGEGLGGALRLLPFERSHAGGSGPDLRWLAIAAVPRGAGGATSDLLLAFVLGHPDATQSLELGRVRGCVEP